VGSIPTTCNIVFLGSGSKIFRSLILFWLI